MGGVGAGRQPGSRTPPPHLPLCGRRAEAPKQGVPGGRGPLLVFPASRACLTTPPTPPPLARVHVAKATTLSRLISISARWSALPVRPQSRPQATQSFRPAALAPFSFSLAPPPSLPFDNMVNMADIELTPADAAGFTSVNTMGATYAPSSAPPSPAPPDAATGTKRKRDAKSTPKFYAVRVGKVPGIYHTWAECLEQVRGHPKAMFKSFPSLTDAQYYLEDENTAGESGVTGSGRSAGKWYGVRCGRKPGVYPSWADVLAQITGWKNPKHRGFKTRIEAELFVKEGQMEQQAAQNGGVENSIESIQAADTAAPAGKRARLDVKPASARAGGIKDENYSPDCMSYGIEAAALYEPGEAPLPPGAEDGFDSSIILDPITGSLRYKTSAEFARTTYQATRPAASSPIRIYTDGSSLANGQPKAVGGVGVYFGPGDGRNISEGLAGIKQSNQRAELTAIIRALEVAPKDRKIIIYTDSAYSIKCTTEWFRKWRENGWVNASHKPVENKDLIQKIIDHLEERYRMNQHRNPGFVEDDCVEYEEGVDPGPWERGPAGVKFKWVKGHDKSEGNNAADELATAGAREARELLECADGHF